MLNRIWRCVFLVGTQITTLAGGASTIIGAAQQYWGVQMPPPWVWWLIAIVLIFVTAVRVQWRLLEEQDKNRNPEPDMRLEDAVKRIRGKDDIFGAEYSESTEVLKALNLIRERGANGSLAIFGSKEVRFVKPEHLSLIPRLPIPKEYWEDNGLDYIAFTTNRHGISRPIGRTDDRTNEYEYIWLDHRQVDSAWPTRRKKLELRNPIRLKS
jgi:hypothetical protein